MNPVLAILAFAVYSVPANSVLPLPHEPGTLWFARFAPAIPLAVAGAIGAGLAAYADAPLVAALFRRRAGRALAATRGWKTVVRAFRVAPDATLFVTSLTGLPPIQVVRVVALSSGYSVHRYAVVVAFGRLPRFWLLAELGAAFAVPGWALAAVTAGVIAIALIATRREADRLADTSEVR